jgi:hypothetical protein
MATSLMTSEENDSESTVEPDCSPQQKVKERTICSEIPPMNMHKQAEHAEKSNSMNNIPLSRQNVICWRN